MKLFLAVLMLFAGTIPASAQWLDRAWPGIPRTADGTPNLTAPAPPGPDGQPDLTGVWNAPPPVARPDPATLQPWVTDLARRRQQEYYKMRPFFRCLPSGPETERSGGWKRFIQTPTTIAILSDDLTYRVIHMDGRELEADPLPSWTGYSVGRWDGDTLVVDSAGFNDKTWVSRYGVSHTEALRITERYRLAHFRATIPVPSRPCRSSPVRLSRRRVAISRCSARPLRVPGKPGSRTGAPSTKRVQPQLC